MTDKQPEALRLADECSQSICNYHLSAETRHRISLELRRLHNENADLLDVLKKSYISLWAANEIAAAELVGNALAKVEKN